MQALTGGVLLLRNKYYIVIYRGKDFIPTSVAAALAERQELTKQVQDIEEKVRIKAIHAASSGAEEGQALAGTLAEFYEAQARWGREISAEERGKMIEENSKAKIARRAKRIEHKLGVVSVLIILTLICKGPELHFLSPSLCPSHLLSFYSANIRPLASMMWLLYFCF